MSSVPFLPSGFGLDDVDNEATEDCFIVQADDLGPSFVCELRPITLKEYRKIFDKMNPQQQTGGFRKNTSLSKKVDREYLTRILGGWRGLSVKNWNSIVKDGKVLTGPPEGVIEFSVDAAMYIYENAWPDSFSNILWNHVKEGAEEQEVEQEKVKKS